MNNTALLEPQTIEFYGDQLLAVQEPGTRRVFVPIARLCENLGVDRASQLQRVQEHEVLNSGLLTLRLQTAGGLQDALCLRLDLVPYWLAQINARRVRQAVREKLILYQRECAAVLWDAFRPSGQPSSVALSTSGELSPAAQAYEMAMAIAAIARQQMSLEAQMTDIATTMSNHAERLAGLEMRLAPKHAISETQAAELAQAIKVVARSLGEQTGRNEYGGVYGQLYREFNVVSYKSLPVEQFDRAMERLRNWYRTIRPAARDADNTSTTG